MLALLELLSRPLGVIWGLVDFGLVELGLLVRECHKRLFIFLINRFLLDLAGLIRALMFFDYIHENILKRTVGYGHIDDLQLLLFLL